MHGPVFAILVAFLVAILHLNQIGILSGSVGEYWKRKDELARASKVFFALSLCSCALIVPWPTLGLACSIVFVSLSLGFSMREWKP